MRGPKDADFAERLSAAKNARLAALEKFKARPGDDDPTVVERRKEREAIRIAREARAAERAEKRAAEEAAALEAKLAEEAERERLEAERAAAEEQRLAEQKAARDARYAARKSRKGRKIRAR